MGGTLGYSPGDIRVDLGISLGSLEIDPLLLGDLLEARPLPLGQPSLQIRLLARVFGVKALGVLNFMGFSLFGEENLCTAFGLSDYVVGFLLFFLLGHTFFYHLSEVLILLRNPGWHRQSRDLTEELGCF